MRKIEINNFEVTPTSLEELEREEEWAGGGGGKLEEGGATGWLSLKRG